MHSIGPFRGYYYFLSNMYVSHFYVGSQKYSSVENYFQSSKAVDPNKRIYLATCAPNLARREGRKVKLIKHWEYIKQRIMMTGMYHKFTQHEDLKQKLIQTAGANLVEFNTWHDNYWGDCQCSRCKHIIGENRTGKLLMELRDAFIRGDIS